MTKRTQLNLYDQQDVSKNFEIDHNIGVIEVRVPNSSNMTVSGKATFAGGSTCIVRDNQDVLCGVGGTSLLHTAMNVNDLGNNNYQLVDQFAVNYSGASFYVDGDLDNKISGGSDITIPVGAPNSVGTYIDPEHYVLSIDASGFKPYFNSQPLVNADDVTWAISCVDTPGDVNTIRSTILSGTFSMNDNVYKLSVNGGMEWLVNGWDANREGYWVATTNTPSGIPLGSHIAADLADMIGFYFTPSSLELSAFCQSEDSLESIFDTIDSSIAAIANNDLTTEVTRATTAENVLDNKFDTEITSLTATDAANYATILADIATDVTRAQQAEFALQVILDTEQTRAEASEQSITNTISTLATLEQTHHNDNQTAINNEISRATTAEQIIQSDVDANEATAANNLSTTETNLQNQIDYTNALLVTQTNSATSNENIILTNINNIISNSDNVDLNSLLELRTAFSQADSEQTELLNLLIERVVNVQTLMNTFLDTNTELDNVIMSRYVDLTSMLLSCYNFGSPLGVDEGPFNYLLEASSQVVQPSGGINGSGSVLFSGETLESTDHTKPEFVGTNLSFVFWIKPSANDRHTNFDILSKYNGDQGWKVSWKNLSGHEQLCLDISSDAQNGYAISAYCNILGDTLFNDEFHHIGITFSGNTGLGVKMYLDGSLQSTSDALGTTLCEEVNNCSINALDTNFILGGYLGEMASLKIYGKELSESEVNVHREALQPTSSNDITVSMTYVSWANEVLWRFEDLQGNIIAQLEAPLAHTYNGSTFIFPQFQAPNGDYVVKLIDTYGDGWHGGVLCIESTNKIALGLSNGTEGTAYINITNGYLAVSSVTNAQNVAPGSVQMSGYGAFGAGNVEHGISGIYGPTSAQWSGNFYISPGNYQINMEIVNTLPSNDRYFRFYWNSAQYFIGVQGNVGDTFVHDFTFDNNVIYGLSVRLVIQSTLPTYTQGTDEDYRNFQIFDSNGNLLSERRTIDGTNVTFNPVPILYLSQGQYTLTTTDPTLVGWDAVSNLSYIAGATSAFRFAHPAGVLTNSTILYVNNRSQYSLTPF